MPRDDAQPQDRYFVGISQQCSAGGLARLEIPRGEVLPAWRVYPSRAAFLAFVRPILEVLQRDPHVAMVTLGPVLGRYGISQEVSVGLELLADAGFHSAALAESVFRQARSASQADAFVARVLPSDEWSDNARPGLTLRFHAPQRIAALGSLRERLTRFSGDGWPIDGFTTVPAGDGTIGLVQGLRYIFLPEISIRWDEALRDRLAVHGDEIDIILLDQATRIGRMCRDLMLEPVVAEARLQWFDVIVAGREDYDAVIPALARETCARGSSTTSMTRKPFSEILDLCNAGVLRHRLRLLDDALLATSPVAGRLSGTS